jgi:hypothetical protein
VGVDLEKHRVTARLREANGPADGIGMCTTVLVRYHLPGIASSDASTGVAVAAVQTPRPSKSAPLHSGRGITHRPAGNPNKIT